MLVIPAYIYKKEHMHEVVLFGELLSIAYSEVKQLYYQNPEFGFYFLRLASARLFQNIETLEKRLAQAEVRKSAEVVSDTA